MNAEPRNQLTTAQRFQLWTAVGAMRSEIEAQKMNGEMLAAAVGKRVAFPVTRSNAVRAAKATGVKLARRIVHPYRGPKADRVAVLAKRVDELAVAVRRLETLLDGLTAPNGHGC